MTASMEGAACDPTALIGLASLARMAFAGVSLAPLKARLLERLGHHENDANALLDLSTVLHLSGQRQLGLSMQEFALRLQQIYHLPPASESAAIRLLAILAPGDLAENNAVEFLTEGSDISLHLLYARPDLPLPATLPEHDLAMVAVCETDRNRPLLRHIGRLLKTWPRPVLCAPRRIARLSRDGASALLQSAPGAVMPITRRLGRTDLAAIGRLAFPLIVRPVDSQKGQGLQKLDAPESVRAYLNARPEAAFYVARYVDYRGPDGQYRKYRIVLIDRRPYACHMAISDRWMVHYMNAGMAESAAKRAEEAAFFESFDAVFAQRHGEALRILAERIGLEYVGVDCGQTPDGKLLIFEVDSGMTVHSMDPVETFPYKQPQMRKVFAAFRRMLLDGARPGSRPPPRAPAKLADPPGQPKGRR